MIQPTQMLVVDDNVAFVEFVATVASSDGFDVTATYTARDFKRAFDRADYGVVLMDVFMPEADGIELATWMRDHGYQGKLIVVTGHDPVFAKAVKIISSNSKMAFTGILEKPVHVHELREMLRAT